MSEKGDRTPTVQPGRPAGPDCRFNRATDYAPLPQRSTRPATVSENARPTVYSHTIERDAASRNTVDLE